MKKITSALAACFALLLAAGCRENALFSEEKTIPGGVWTYRDSLDFRFSMADTSARCDLSLDFAYADTFAAQNLYLKLFTTFPGGRRLEKTVSFDLFDARGNPLGTRSSGGTCRLRAVLQENARFDRPGEYGLTVHQFMRRDSLPGVAAVGLVLEKRGKG